MLTEEKTKELEEVLTQVEEVSIEDNIQWLKAAFLSQEQTIQILKDRKAELKECFLQRWGTDPKTANLSVREAQLLNVCRICLRNVSVAKTPLILNFGEEFAHELCLGYEKVKNATPS